MAKGKSAKEEQEEREERERLAELEREQADRNRRGLERDEKQALADMERLAEVAPLEAPPLDPAVVQDGANEPGRLPPSVAQHPTPAVPPEV